MTEADKIIKIWKDNTLEDYASCREFKITDNPILNGDVTLDEVVEKIKNRDFHVVYPEYGYEDGPSEYIFDFSDIYRNKGFRFIWPKTTPVKVSIQKRNVRSIDPVLTGQNIQAIMQNANITVKDIQKVFGFATPQAIYKWLKGSSVPTIDNLVVLSDIFGIRIDDIVVKTNW